MNIKKKKTHGEVDFRLWFSRNKGESQVPKESKVECVSMGRRIGAVNSLLRNRDGTTLQDS